ncbi:protein-disulfide reductase DsbD family protein [Caenispirillum bisanense]|uniref:protein-disulfide reductase DsbD family protein n=1 Tax=Caenispirillum bisanense TaxID=414052 RepID=UPI0031DCE1A1
MRHTAARLFVLVLTALLAVALPARAQWAEPGSSGWVETAEADVRLVAAEGSTGDRDTLTLGLHFRLKDDWKVYWRDAGDAGYPPEIDWSGSENLAAAEMAFPAPHRFSVLGIETAGYKSEVVYPLTVRLEEAGRPLRAQASVDYLICAEICIPGRVDLALALPGGPAGPTQFAHLIESWKARVPAYGSGNGLTVTEAVVETGGERQQLRVTVTADPPVRAPDLFVEGPDELRIGPPQVTLQDGGRTAVLRAAVREGTLTAGEALRLTIVDGDRGLQSAAAPAVVAAPPAVGGAPVLAAMLGLALLGGLILNIMPCVLPVLSLKVMGVARLGGAERRTVRLAFLATAAGIVATFLLLAAGAVALKAAGAAVGWGIQFQQPLFLVAMIVLLSLFAANLWGLFEIRLPGAVGDVAVAHDRPHGMAGHFGSGVFATLLATPCSAPFLGTAIGFALARGPLEIAAIFAALGIGMSLPYLLVAAAPGIARLLPRPGRWMLTVKTVLGGALALTAVWLLWVLSAQVGTRAAVGVAALMLAAVAVLAARRRIGAVRGRLAAGVVAGLAVAAFTAPWWPAAGRPDAPAADAVTAWAAFDEAAIATLVGDGKVVFVDVTADWCVTCKVNKAAVVDRGAVAGALKQPGVVPMQADWTNPDERISRYLQSFGRYGIPFNVVYGPAAPEGIPLPELLTERAVLDALVRAGG